MFDAENRSPRQALNTGSSEKQYVGILTGYMNQTIWN